MNIHRLAASLAWAVASTLALPGQANIITNGDFTGGQITPWVQGGYTCGSKIINHDAAGSGASNCFTCLHGGNSSLSKNSAGYYPPNTIEQKLLQIQGLTYLFTADVLAFNLNNSTGTNADAGLIEIWADGTLVGSHNFGRYPRGSILRGRMCFTYTPSTTGVKVFKIGFSRKYYCNAQTPSAFIDNIQLVQAPSFPIICPRGERRINTTVSIDVLGMANADFVLYLGLSKLNSGFTIPGFAGTWWLSGPWFQLFLAKFNSAGLFVFQPKIPNHPGLVGFGLHWQSIQAAGSQVSIGEPASFSFYR